MAQKGVVALCKGASRQWGRFSAAERTSKLPALCNLSRPFSSKLFVGGLSYHTTEEMLRKAFAEHGDVVDVRIITDRETGKSRGFGFVTFSSDADAETAKAKMSSHLLDGRFIRVDLASTRTAQSPASPRPFGNSAPASSGFSFGTAGTRPPVVEDWGPLPFHSVNPTQTTDNQGGSESTTSAPYRGSADSSNAGVSSTSCADSIATSSRSTSTQQSSRSVFASQNSGSATEVRSSSFDGATCDNVASFGTQQPTIVNNGSAASPSISSTASAQGFTLDNLTTANTSSFDAGPGQSPASRRFSEAGMGPSKTGNFKQENNFKIGRSGFGSSGGGRPPSVIDLGSATYDFRNFPEFDIKACKDFKVSGELEESKKRVLFQTNKLGPKRSETWEKKLTEEAIPPAQGPLFDFGLNDVPDSPSPSGADYSRHGGFSLNVNLDELPEAEPVRLPYSIFTARTLPPLDLPWLTPEADNWSEIGKPPRRIEDSPYSPFSPDLKDDPEFWWDPYDFDPEAKSLKVEEVLEANTSKEAEGEAKLSKGPEVEAKLPKETEADEVSAASVAVSSG